MIRRILIAIALLALPSIASAREAFHGWCELGNQSVVTQGLSSTTKAQQSNPSCVVTVFVHGGGLATIYSDNNNTPLANPFQAQLNGLVIFYANDGRYDIQFSPGTTYLDWLLCDPFTPGAVCSGASSGAHNLLSTTHLDTIPFSPPVRGDVITAQNQTSPTGVNPSWARLPLGANNFVLTSNGVDAIWAPVAGGGGCTLPGNDTGILTEHPIGTCYNSIDATWNDAVSSGTVNGQILLIGDGTNVVTAPSGGKSVKEAFVFGDHNTLTGKGASQLGMFVFGSSSTINNCSECAAIGDVNSLGTASGLALSEEYAIGPNNTLVGSFVYALGDFNVVNGSGVLVIGEGSSLNTNGAGGLQSSILVEDTATVTLGGTNSKVIDTQVMGSNDTFTVGLPTGGAVNQLNCLHGVGGSNSFTITGGNSSSVDMATLSWLGKNNQFTSTGFSIDVMVVSGNNNTINSTSANLNHAGIFGSAVTLANCNNCFAYGENVSLSTNSTVAMGISAAPEIAITAGAVAIAAHLNQSVAGKFANTCTMAAGTTCTFSVSAAYSGTPICISAPTTAVFTGGLSACTISGTTVTITSQNSNSLTWGAILVGNPN